MARRSINPVVETAKVLAKFGRISFGAILKEVDISRQTLDTYLKIMVGKKLILLEQDPKDKRKYLYWLNPNELCIITVDEAIDAIRKELKAVGEELTSEEEEKLREILRNEVRKIILTWLKMNIIKNEKPEEVILHILNIAYGVYQEVEAFKQLSKLPMFGKLMKDKADEVFDNTTAENVKLYLDLVDKLPKSFLKKWEKTKAYQSSPMTQLALAINLLIKSLKIK